MIHDIIWRFFTCLAHLFLGFSKNVMSEFTLSIIHKKKQHKNNTNHEQIKFDLMKEKYKAEHIKTQHLSNLVLEVIKCRNWDLIKSIQNDYPFSSNERKREIELVNGKGKTRKY